MLLLAVTNIQAFQPCSGDWHTGRRRGNLLVQIAAIEEKQSGKGSDNADRYCRQ
jgi:hypothetical protein